VQKLRNRTSEKRFSSLAIFIFDGTESKNVQETIPDRHVSSNWDCVCLGILF